MRRFRLRRPSPAMAVALTALFLSLGGGAYALTLPSNSVGPAQLRKAAVVNSKYGTGSISNSKIRANAITNSKIGNNQVNSAKVRAASLLGSDLAAGTITGAQVNVSTLGVTKWALVSGGTVQASSGGVTVASEVANTTYVNFGASQAGRPILATLNGNTVPDVGEIAAAPCGGSSSTNPGAVNCPAAFNNPNVVAVSTFASNGAPAQRPFYVAVPQG